MNLKSNKQIRAPSVRVIDQDGKMLGLMHPRDAQKIAEDLKLDLVEIAPNAEPPVCKIMNYGKFRYDQTKKEKESKKAQHQIKVKEIKLKPNIDTHDLEIKIKHAKEFLADGDKVKISMMFRGREIAHSEIGQSVVQKACEALEPFGTPESPLKRMGKTMTVVLAPVPVGKKKVKEGKDAKE